MTGKQQTVIAYLNTCFVCPTCSTNNYLDGDRRDEAVECASCSQGIKLETSKYDLNPRQ